jgi:hypothetical protein
MVEALNISYGIQVGSLTLVAGGADLDATAYKAESGNSSYFIKVKSGPFNPIFPAILELLNTSNWLTERNSLAKKFKNSLLRRYFATLTFTPEMSWLTKRVRFIL